MEFHRSVVQGALYLAIRAKEAEEKAAGYTGPSGFLASLIEMKKQVDEGNDIRICD